MVGCKDVPDTFSSQSSLSEIWVSGYNAGWKNCSTLAAETAENDRMTWRSECKFSAFIGGIVGAAISGVTLLALFYLFSP